MRPGIIGSDKSIHPGEIECTCSICRGKTFLPYYLYEKHILEASSKERAIVYCNACSDTVVREATEAHGGKTTVTYFDQTGEKGTVSGKWHNLISRCDTVGDMKDIPPVEPGKSQAFVGLDKWAPSRTKVECRRCHGDCYLPHEIAAGVGDGIVLCIKCGGEIMDMNPTAKFFGVRYGGEKNN